MAAPIPPVPPKSLTGVTDAQNVQYQRKGDTTLVILEKTDGNKTYWITVKFDKPIEEDRMISYLNEKATVDKIKHLIDQVKVFDTFGKQNLNITSNGRETLLTYKNKKNIEKRLKLGEASWAATSMSEADRLQHKFDEADKAGNTDRAKKFAAKKQNFLLLMKKFEGVAQTVLVPPQPSDQTSSPIIQVSQNLPQPLPQSAQPPPQPVLQQVVQQMAQPVPQPLPSQQVLQNALQSPQLAPLPKQPVLKPVRKRVPPPKKQRKNIGPHPSTTTTTTTTNTSATQNTNTGTGGDGKKKPS